MDYVDIVAHQNSVCFLSSHPHTPDASIPSSCVNFLTCSFSFWATVLQEIIALKSLISTYSLALQNDEIL